MAARRVRTVRRRRRSVNDAPLAADVAPATPFGPLPRVPLAALAVTTTAAYLNAVRDALTYDDGVVAPLAQRPSWQRVVDQFQHDAWYGLGMPGPSTGNYRPLAMSTIIAEGWVHGGRALYLHATAVAIHVATTLVLFGFLRALLRDVSRDGEVDGDVWDPSTVGAWGAATVFGVHPVHVDAVASYYNRSEVLVTGATYGLLWLLWSRVGRDRRVWWTASAIYLAALLCKESASTAPVLVVLLFALFRPAPWRVQLARLRPLALLALPLGVYSSLRSSAVPWPAEAGSRLAHYLSMQSWSSRLSTVSSVLADGLKLIVWPHPLRCSYDAYVPHDLAPATVLHAALVAAAVAARRRLPVVTFAVAAFYIGVIPSTPLMQDFSMFPGIFAERHLYLPSAGLAVALAFGLASLARARGRNAVHALVAACALVFVPLCHRRNDDWASNLTLFEADYRLDPANGHNAALLARTLVGLDRVDRAAEVCDRFFRTQPRGVKMLDECAMVYQRAGRVEDTVAMLRGSFEMTQLGKPLMDIARLRLRLGDRAAAEVEFERAIAATANPVNRHLRRGEMLLRLYPERVAEIRAEFEAALAADPSSDVARDWLRRVPRGN